MDERWDETAEELGGGLRRLLSKECTTRHVRDAEQSPQGRDPHLEAALEDYGLFSLPHDPVLLARAAVEVGRFLVPVPFVEVTPASVVLGSRDTGYGLEGPVPAAVGSVVIRRAPGVAVVDLNGHPRRTTAGDFLVSPGDGEARTAGDAGSADRMWRLVRLLDAGRLVGAAQALLELGVAYSKDRIQFGRPVGSFQGVAYKLVDSAVAVDGADLLLRKAASLARAGAGGDGAPPLAFAIMARSKAVQASRLVATTVHQVMGGYGFAMEYDCQLYSRRIRSWTMRLGDTGAELRRLARLVLDAEGRDSVEHLWNHDRGIPLPRWAVEADASTPSL